MKFSAIITILATAVAVSASAVPDLEARDVCGGSSGSDQRRTNSPCGTGNGDRHFCGCDRTDIVQCINGFWREITDCGSARCHGNSQGSGTCQ